MLKMFTIPITVAIDPVLLNHSVHVKNRSLAGVHGG